MITEQTRYPLPTVVRMYEDTKSYVLNPDFQRRHRWNRRKQSRLMPKLTSVLPVRHRVAKIRCGKFVAWNGFSTIWDITKNGAQDKPIKLRTDNTHD